MDPEPVTEATDPQQAAEVDEGREHLDATAIGEADAAIAWEADAARAPAESASDGDVGQRTDDAEHTEAIVAVKTVDDGADTAKTGRRRKRKLRRSN